MADRSHLTPARTIDKRGRSTIVYRNEAASPSAAAKARVPALASPALPGTLRDPKPLTASQLEELAAHLERINFGGFEGLHPLIVTEPDGRTAAALAVEAVAAGTLTEGETDALFIHAARRGDSANRSREGIGSKVGARFARDLLLVAARVAARRPNRGGLWIIDLVAATQGSCFRRREALETEAQFDSLAAVVEFTMKDRILQNFTYESSGVGVGDLRTIRNRELEDLIRERPHDLDRILQYLDERNVYGMDSTEDVDELRHWLNTTEDAPSLGGGWL